MVPTTVLMKAILVAATSLAGLNGLLQESAAIIIPQPDAPLQITAYNAKYQQGVGRYEREGIRHEVEYRNGTERKIVAVRIGLVSFDVWNEFLDRTGGIDMDDLSPGATDKGTWVATAYGDFTFVTGVAYVDRVRFDDGKIWKADLDNIATALRQIQDDFDVTKLTEQEPGGN